MKLPQARTSEIIEQEADKELLIYDLQNNKAYSLNETLKTVYKACGKSSIEDLKRKHKFTDDLIYLSLDELAASNLIEGYQSNHFAGFSRRQVIKKVGLATMAALPVIVAIAAPAAATAASLTACERINCRNGNLSCNLAPGCEALGAGYVCCSALGFCNCATLNTCLSNGGEVCPR